MSRFVIKVQHTLYIGVNAKTAIEAERIIESLNPRITTQQKVKMPSGEEVVVDLELSRHLEPTVKPEVADNRKIKRFVRLCDSCGEWLGYPNQFRKNICEKCKEIQE
tara:strand:- start:94 stop:414 length:321 start_codon:yes stop_codon:yes gene_type:complete